MRINYVFRKMTDAAYFIVPLTANLILMSWGNASLAADTAAQWNNINVQTKCEAMNPSYCVGAYGFTVNSSGQYTVGPDPSHNVVVGEVTSDELVALVDAANTVVSNRVAETPTCTNSGPVPGVSNAVSIELKDGAVDEVYHSRGVPRQTCFLGGQDNAQKLQSEMKLLVQEYYPRPFL